MVSLPEANPYKASAKMGINSSLIGICLTIFGVLWAFAPERLSIEILLQIIFAIPLLYISSNAYAKIAYWKKVKFWDYLGWFTGTTATAFVLNLVGILTFSLGHPIMTLTYFLTLWSLLVIYTIINSYHNPGAVKINVFKLAYFILIQLIFGIGILYL